MSNQYRNTNRHVTEIVDLKVAWERFETGPGGVCLAGVSLLKSDGESVNLKTCDG